MMLHIINDISVWLLKQIVCKSEIDAEFGIQWNETNVSETVESNCPPGKTGK